MSATASTQTDPVEEPPTTTLPVELWEKVASMRQVFWKVTTAETVLYLDGNDVGLEQTTRPHRTVVRYLLEVPTDDDTSDLYNGYHKRIHEHLNRGEFAVLGAAHPKLAPTHNSNHPIVLRGQPPAQVGDPLWKMYTVFYQHDRGYNEDGDFDEQSVATTTLVGAERVGGGPSKKRKADA